MQIDRIGLLAAQLHGKQMARREGMAKAIAYRTSNAETSERTEEKESTNSGSSSSIQNKQAKSYEVLEQAASKVQEYAAKLKELGSTATDEKKLKEDAFDYIDKLVEAYNELYKEMQDMGDATNLLHCNQMNSICETYVQNLSSLGITKDKDGALSFDKEKVENISVETINASAALLKELSDKCSGIEAGAAASIKLWNSLYGTTSYDESGSGNTYYGENGSWYNAIG